VQLRFLAAKHQFDTTIQSFVSAALDPVLSGYATHYGIPEVAAQRPQCAMLQPDSYIGEHDDISRGALQARIERCGLAGTVQERNYLDWPRSADAARDLERLIRATVSYNDDLQAVARVIQCEKIAYLLLDRFGFVEHWANNAERRLGGLVGDRQDASAKAVDCDQEQRINHVRVRNKKYA
jgi:hypothetical protein